MSVASPSFLALHSAASCTPRPRVTPQIPFSHLWLVKYRQKHQRGFPVQPLTAQLPPGILDAQSSTAQLLHPKPALLLPVIHGYPATPALETERSSSEQNSQQKSRHLTSHVEPCFPFDSNPKQQHWGRKAGRFLAPPAFPSPPLRRWSSLGRAGSEPAPALGLPVHGRLALLQRLLQLCQLAATHFQPLPGRQERKVSRTQHNRNLYKDSLNFQGRFHQTQAGAVTLALQLLNLRISHKLLTTANHSCHRQSSYSFLGQVKWNNWQERSLTSTFWRDWGFWKVQFKPSFIHWYILYSHSRICIHPPYDLESFKRVISTWSHINTP